MKNTLVSTIDFFYPPFKRIMPLQTFRYAACGGGNMMLGFLIFTAVFHLIAAKQDAGLVLGCFKVVHTRINDADVLMMDLGAVAFKVHSFALSCSSSVVFVVGFLLNKYVVFTGSYLKGRIQLFRYFLASVSSFSINYFLLQALVLFLHVHPVLAQVFVTVIVVTISYFMQQYFTFKVKQKQ